MSSEKKDEEEGIDSSFVVLNPKSTADSTSIFCNAKKADSILQVEPTSSLQI